MPRRARILSATNIYHVVVKGLDQQVMFEENKDFIKYIEILEKYITECDLELYAYCLMSNHVHLVLRTSEQPIDIIFKKINTHYAIWFNMKYKREGHLQQDRFYSEPIENASYFLSAIRYVHLNPLHAGCETSPGTSYPWNSFYEYRDQDFKLVNSKLVYNYISEEDFIEFHNQENSNKHIDIDSGHKRIPDDVAKDIIYRISSCSNSTEFKDLSLVDREKYILQLHEEGLSIRQLNRLTGIPKGIIERIVRSRHL